MAQSVLYSEAVWALRKAFRVLIPEPQDRHPIGSLEAVASHLLAFGLFLFMCYLARRPDTHLIRLLLLPAVIVAGLHACFGFYWSDPTLNCYNWGQCLYIEFTIGKSLEFAFAKEGRLKVGETRPGEIEEPAKGSTYGHGTAEKSAPGIYPRWFSDAIEVMCTMRGLGWDFGQGVYVPPEKRSQERVPFLRATLLTFLCHYLALDFLESVLKLFPGVGSPYGGTIFYSHLPPVQRYAVSTFIHVLTGTALIQGFGMVYDLMTLIGVGLFHNSPAVWPPILANPWISDSMHIFWGKRWHQLLRQTFFVFGGHTGYWLGGHFGLVIMTFAASGFYHEASVYALNRGFDWRVPVFFTLQGPLLIAERAWRVVTGRRVGGLFGRLWVYFCIVVLGQPMVDAWHMRGLAGAMIIPPSLSPTRRILWPLFGYAIERFNH
ncbi:hypothetical protein PLICRDRAFT_39539 [Plicaturopsis crispa FD-325 SS-3]|nr:hypothetical protein PLICRDRAFT_39539 [Plicaturopsis crispa FD-325 SS-3]